MATQALPPEAAAAARRALPGSPSRTIVGVARTDLPVEAQRAMRGAPVDPRAATAVGVGAPGAARPVDTVVGFAPPAEPPRAAPPADSRPAAPRAPSSYSGTLLGVSPKELENRLPEGTPPPPPSAPHAAPGVLPRPAPGPSRTLLGVAVPGVAPTFEEEPAPPSVELGATLGAQAKRDEGRPLARTDHKLRKRVQPPPGGMLGPLPKVERPERKKRRRTDRRAYWVLAAAGIIGVAGGAFALLYRSAPPIVARVRADEKGTEYLEIRCASCADGTTVDLDGARASVSAQVAQIPLAARFPVGETVVRIAIDRPNGRDETVKVPVQVAYRITPDVTTLSGERPSVTITVEAMKGTTVTMAGKELDLQSGRSVEVLDVSDDLAGTAQSLVREVPFQVKSASGEETGTVRVQLPIAPLTVAAPGPSALIDGPSFLLVGTTAKGASLRVGAHAVPVKPDGSFSHAMNVSTVGAATVEVRAELPGAAPRLYRIKVRRVGSLEEAAKEFLLQSGVLGLADARAKGKEAAGKPITLTGEVMAATQEGAPTTLALKGAACASPPKGAKPDAATCEVKVRVGVPTKLDRGDLVTVYGRVLETEPVVSVDAEFVRKAR